MKTPSRHKHTYKNVIRPITINIPRDKAFLIGVCTDEHCKKETAYDYGDIELMKKKAGIDA